MTYSKPTVRALDLHVDVASCKPAPRNTVCPGIKVGNLCFAVKTVTVVQAESSATGSLAAPSIPMVDGSPLLP